MKASESKLYDFISNSTQNLIIPVYQRNYDWDKSQCEMLIADIKNVCNTGNRHFMGTICFCENGNELIIIDGQQRITSVMLLIKALHDLSSNEGLRRNIYDFALTSRNLSNFDLIMRIKLKPIEKDRDVFDKIIRQNEFDEKAFSDKQKRSTIYINYLYFRSALNQMLAEGYEDIEIFNALNKLQIVKLQTEEENPQIVFEGLNSKGQALTKADLIRNYILMPLTPDMQAEMYRKYWLPMEAVFQSSDEVELFLFHYMLLKKKSMQINIPGIRGRISINNLYPIFKSEYSNLKDLSNEEIEDIFIEIKKCALIYRNFIFTEKVMPTSHNEKQLYVLFNILKKKETAIFLMRIYKYIDEGKIESDFLAEMLDILVTFSFRSYICGHMGFSAQFSTLSISKFEKLIESGKNPIDALYEILLSGTRTQAFPLNVVFRKALIDSDIFISSREICKYLLHEIEIASNPKEHIPYEQGTIEHICPQKLDKAWKEYLSVRNSLEDHELFVHKIGNLTLTGYNSELSNNSFKEKSSQYKKSNYSITKEIGEYQEWSNLQIEDRSKKMAKMCLDIWSLPEEYNVEKKTKDDITYDLESDFTLLSKQKPHELLFNDKTRSIDTWIGMQKYIFEQLYEYDEFIFADMVKDAPFTAKNLISRKPEVLQEDSRERLECSEEYWLNKKSNTATILRNIKIALEYYDENCKSNLAESFLFTIKKSSNADYSGGGKRILITEEKVRDGSLVQLKQGDKVKHPKFGEGVVIHSDERITQVKFGNIIKTFTTAFDEWEKIE